MTAITALEDETTEASKPASQQAGDVSALVPALIAVQLELPAIPKDKVAQIRGGRNYRYADINTILRLVRPILGKHGVAVTQAIDGTRICTQLTHKSGQWMSSTISLGEYRDMQALGSAITYARRYGLVSLLAIDADDDDDGAAATTDLGATLAAIEAARTPDGLVAAMARVDALSEGQKEVAREAFKQKESALLAHTERADVVRAEIRAKIKQRRDCR